jgi:hypothetical protein
MKLLNAEQTSDYLGIPKATLAKMRWAGTGCKFLKIGAKVYYRAADLDAWLAEHERTSTTTG